MNKGNPIVTIHRHVLVGDIRKQTENVPDDYVMCVNAQGDEIIFQKITDKHEVMRVDWSKMEQT